MIGKKLSPADMIKWTVVDSNGGEPRKIISHPPPAVRFVGTDARLPAEHQAVAAGRFPCFDHARHSQAATGGVPKRDRFLGQASVCCLNLDDNLLPIRQHSEAGVVLRAARRTPTKINYPPVRERHAVEHVGQSQAAKT